MYILLVWFPLLNILLHITAACLSSLLCIIPLHGHTTVYLSIPSGTDIWAVSSFGYYE